MKQTVSNVFRRIAGDQTVRSIQRMETAFGGGKTHSLIACVHIANLGTELADVTGDILEAEYLPEPHTVTVVGITGDATAVTPVTSNEISAVLAKRLFTSIDKSAAYDTMEAYAEVYQRNPSLLPEAAVSVRFRDRMVKNYRYR